MNFNFNLINDVLPFYTSVEQIFINRNVMPNEIEHYKNVSEQDINDPLLLTNMKEGAALLVKHLKQHSKIGVVCDCDCDGFTSAALIINYLYSLFPTVIENRLQYFIHENKVHGVSDIVENILSTEIKFLIIPDAGGGDFEYIDLLAAKGIEILVLDHHDFNFIDYGKAIVINNQLGEYPNKTLSGVGVVLKFCEYLDKLLKIQNSKFFYDLAAVGCVADLMPLTDYETLYYIRNGLKNISNPFIKAMVNKQEYSINKHGGLDPYCIGFYIAPFINATIRIGTIEEKEMIFKSMLDLYGNTEVASNKRGHKDEMTTLAEEACRISSNIKNRQDKLKDENLVIIEDLIKKRELLKNKIITVKLEKELGMNKNILGLIANNLCDKYQMPILLLNESEEEINNEKVKVWAGSCRNYRYSEITNLRSFLEQFPQVLYASGHPSAFGICVLDEGFNDFIKSANESLKEMSTDPYYRVDIIYENEPSVEDVLAINDLKPYWGQNFDEPYIAITDINLDENNLQLLGKDKNPTLKISLKNGVELIKFKSSQEEYENLLNSKIEIVGKCSSNTWLGHTTPQIKIEEYNIIDGYF